MKEMDQNRLDKVRQMAVDQFRCPECKTIMNVMAYQEAKRDGYETFKAIMRCEKCDRIYDIFINKELSGLIAG